MEFIRNQKYKISINEIGGGLNSIIDLESKKELIHEVNDGGWIYQDIMIFPFIGKYDYFYKNINYKTSSRHGFLRNKKLSFAKINENSILGTYESNNLDLLEYPFKFKILIKYELIDDKYNVNIEVFNLDNKTMPYLLKMADFSNCVDKDGKVNDDSLKQALQKVIDDVPGLKKQVQNSVGITVGANTNNNQGSNSPAFDFGFAGVRPRKK